MSAEFDLDRVLGGWIREEAPAHAPDRVLEMTMARIGTTRQRRRIDARLRRAWVAMSGVRRVAVIGLTLLALATGIVVAGLIVARLTGPPGPTMVMVQPDAGSPLADELTFVAVEPDGSRRELGRVTTAQLGGQWGGWPIVLSPDGHLVVPISVEGGASTMAVVDLRDLGAPAQRPDFEAGFGSWSPDDRLAGIPNRGGVAIFDPATNTTTFAKSPDENVNIIETDFRAQWAADGSGVLAARYGDQVTYGVLTADGSFTPGQVPGFDGALGARRVRSDGARLQCSPGDDSPCEPPAPSLFAVLDGSPTSVWTEPDTTIRIVDFAWGADGTVWFLAESLGDGPRTVQLVHIRADGTRDLLATYDGVADDADPNSYFPAASFLTLSPDDSRIVIRIAGDQGSPGQAWVVDTRKRTSERLDGTPVGWLTEGTLSSPRPVADPLRETDPSIRGAWTTVGPDGPVSIAIRRATIDTTATDPGLTTFTVESTGPDTIRVGRVEAAAPCDASAPGTYRWNGGAGGLTLTVVDDPCTPRSTLLAGAFERELPTPDSGSVTADAGARYVASKFVLPFAVTIPASGSVGVDQHGHDGVSFTKLENVSPTKPGGENGPAIRISTAVSGLADPCEHHGGQITLAPGIAGVRSYLEGIDKAGLEIGSFEPATVAGKAGVVTEIRGGDAACPDGFAAAYLFGDPGYLSVVDSRLYLIEPTEGTVVAITTPLDASTAAQVWIDELLSSISFDR